MTCRALRQGTALTLPVPGAAAAAADGGIWCCPGTICTASPGGWGCRPASWRFGKSYLAPQTLLPALRLTPDPRTGNCRFFEGSACAIHEARPLACALYPLGQSIDPVTAKIEYYVQTPLCGARTDGGRVLNDYLTDAAILDRAGIDARWAVVCTRLSEQLQAAADHPHFAAAVKRVERALYYDYELGDDFYPQFQQNIEILQPLLEKLLA